MPDFWLGLVLILRLRGPARLAADRRLRAVRRRARLGWLRTIAAAGAHARPRADRVHRPHDARLDARSARTRTSCAPPTRRACRASTSCVRHGLPNALIPIVTVIGIVAGALLGGTVIIEQVFSIPGVGRLIIGAIAVARLSRDPGRPAVPRGDLSRRQPDGRHPLRGRRSAREARRERRHDRRHREAGTSPTRETLARLLRHRSFVIGGSPRAGHRAHRRRRRLARAVRSRCATISALRLHAARRASTGSAPTISAATFFAASCSARASR